MIHTIRVKKAFTLIELVLVIILISIVYYLSFSNLTSSREVKYKVNIENIKEFMLKNFKYEKELAFVCIEDDAKDCYIFIDKNINKDIKIENFFKDIPDIYNYDKDLSKYVFTKIRLDEIEFEPFFEFIINSDKKHKDIIVDTLDSRVYLLNSISRKIEKFENTNDIVEQFSSNEIEVKDAL